MKRGRPQTQVSSGGVTKKGKRARTMMIASSRAPMYRTPGYQVSRGSIADAKFHNVTLAAYQCNTTGSITHLDVIPQGNTVNSREGKAFRIRSVQVRGYFQSDTATTVAVAGAYLIWDMQPNKALPAITDIFDTSTSDSFAKRENKQRFIILKKWVKSMVGNITTPSTGKETQVVEKWLKMPEDAIAMCTSADTTGAIGNRINGALLLVTLGNVAAGTQDSNFQCGFRVNFSDL